MAVAGAAGAVAAVSSSDSNEDDTVEMVSKTICEVVKSTHFDRKALQGNFLKLSEAFCLLWQDSSTGDVDGRQGSKRKLGGVVFAVLLDLFVLGKIQIDIVEKKFFGIKYKNRNVVVKDPTPTGTYLDRALFNQILHKHKRGRVLEVEDWVRDCISTSDVDNNVASVTLDNLVRRHILGEEKTLLGFATKYPTVDPEPNRKLVSEIRKTALEGCKPEAYMRVLLTIVRATDNLYSFYDPLLEKIFTSKEYSEAKRNIKKLVIFV